MLLWERFHSQSVHCHCCCYDPHNLTTGHLLTKAEHSRTGEQGWARHPSQPSEGTLPHAATGSSPLLLLTKPDSEHLLKLLPWEVQLLQPQSQGWDSKLLHSSGGRASRTATRSPGCHPSPALPKTKVTSATLASSSSHPPPIIQPGGRLLRIDLPLGLENTEAVIPLPQAEMLPLGRAADG